MKRLIMSILGMLMLCSLNAQTAGTLSFNFTEAPQSSTYGSEGKHVLAIWIESCSSCVAETTHYATATETTHGGTMVATNLVYCCGGSTSDHHPIWKKTNGNSGIVPVNATSGATRTSFASRTISWDGKNTAGTLQPDGSYRVCVEETWNHGTTGITQRYFPFTKGPNTDSQSPTADITFSGLSLTWTPNGLGNEDFTVTPVAVVYPNPSKGIFTVDFKNEVKNIKVISILGEVIYNMDIDSSLVETTKTIDMTGFTNGIYLVILENDKGTASYKIALDK